MVNPSELRRGDIVEYVGNKHNTTKMNPHMIGSVGVYLGPNGENGADVEWIVCTYPALGKDVKGMWFIHNLKKL